MDRGVAGGAGHLAPSITALLHRPCPDAETHVCWRRGALAAALQPGLQGAVGQGLVGLPLWGVVRALEGKGVQVEVWRGSPQFPLYQASSLGRVANRRTGRVVKGC